MPSSRLILGRPLLLLPSVLPWTGESDATSEEAETIPWQLRLPDQAASVTLQLACILFPAVAPLELIVSLLIPKSDSLDSHRLC